VGDVAADPAGFAKGITLGAGVFLVRERIANLSDPLRIPAYGRIDAVSAISAAAGRCM
jgi:hypothetical protein